MTTSWKKVLLCGAALAIMASGSNAMAQDDMPADHGAPEGHAHMAAEHNTSAVHTPAADVPAFAESETCANGTLQSPINIAEYMQEDLPKLKIAYAPTTLHVVNSGQGLGVVYDPGSKFMSGETVYDLMQFNFEAPSENYVNGAPYAMEMQLMHHNEAGEIAVLSVMMKLGAANPAIQSIWDNIPAAGGRTDREDVTLDMAALLPENGEYYTFTGSLTAPPCTEGVKWHVLKEPIEISLEQLNAFQSVYGGEPRPVQPLNGRVIKGN